METHCYLCTTPAGRVAFANLQKGLFASGIVAVDSGHNDYHTAEGRYEPFASLLNNDGFRVVDSNSPFTTEIGMRGYGGIPRCPLLAQSGHRPNDRF